MKKFFAYVIALVGLSLLSNCTVEEVPTFESAQDVKVTKFNRRKLKIEGNLVFKNPSQLDATITDLGLDILLEDKKVDNIQLGRNHTIKAGETLRVPFTVKLKSKEVIPMVYQTTYGDFNKTSINYGMKGVAAVKMGEQNLNINIDFTENISLESSDDKEEEDAENTIESLTDSTQKN